MARTLYLIRKFASLTRRLLLAMSAMLMVAIVCYSGLTFFALATASAQTGNPFFPPEMNAAEEAKEAFVVGDLGGVAVRIPSYFAEYLQYDDDPGFGEMRKGSVPIRTDKSVIRAFGITARFPDMAGRSTPELLSDYNKYHDFRWEHYYDPEKNVSPWIS